MTDAEKIKALITAVGSLAEMASIFYKGMIDSGADPTVAQAGMFAFIQAYWHEANETARRDRQEQEE